MLNLPKIDVYNLKYITGVGNVITLFYIWPNACHTSVDVLRPYVYKWLLHVINWFAFMSVQKIKAS